MPNIDNLREMHFIWLKLSDGLYFINEHLLKHRCYGKGDRIHVWLVHSQTILFF